MTSGYRRGPCFGCKEEFWVEELRVAKCLGCGSKFKRCEGCFRKFTGCSDECRRLARKELANAWVKPPHIEDKSEKKT